MPVTTLHEIFVSTVISKLMYASPACNGFANASDNNRIEAFIRKAKRLGFHRDSAPSFDTLCLDADKRLFKDIISNSSHVLHHLLPQKQPSTYNLRPRSHAYSLPRRTSRLIDCNFSIRLLYSYA